MDLKTINEREEINEDEEKTSAQNVNSTKNMLMNPTRTN